MVRPAFHLFAVTGIALLSILPLAAKDLADYAVGDAAENDITTPIPLDVTDVAATEALRERASAETPAVFCFYPLWAGETEAAFHAAYRETRASFSNVVQLVFHKRKLSPRETASPDFEQLVSAFRKQNMRFPVETNVAALWAGGGSDAEFESRLLAQLRQTMRSPVCSDYVPAGIEVGATARLLTVTNRVTPTVEMAATLGLNQPANGLLSLARAKLELQNRFAPEETETAQYVASFIKPNCFIDAELTRGLRHNVSEAIWAGEHYKAGEVLVRGGAVIGKRTGAALALLNEKLALEQLRRTLAGNQAAIAQAHRRNDWFAAGFVTALVISIFLIWQLKRRRAAIPLPLVMTDDGVIEVPAGAVDGGWRQRALIAERRAEKANAVIREGMISHLAQWMSDTVIQKLILQRSHMLDTQHQAASEMDLLGERLQIIHSRMQDRLVAYELQIAELEKKLEAKDEMNRELIRAEISTIEQILESERARSQVEFN